MFKREPPVRAGIVFLVLGMAVLGFTAYQAHTVSYLLRHGLQATAVVVKNIARPIRSRIAYYPLCPVSHHELAAHAPRRYPALAAFCAGGVASCGFLYFGP